MRDAKGVPVFQLSRLSGDGDFSLQNMTLTALAFGLRSYRIQLFAVNPKFWTKLNRISRTQP